MRPRSARATGCGYMVLPRRPTGTEGWEGEQLAAFVTRNAMIGAVPATLPEEAAP
jgi:nitrile hydratase